LRGGVSGLLSASLEEFDRDLRLLLASMIPHRVVMGFLEVMRVIYLYLIGLSAVQIGLITTVGTLASALESVVSGSLSDKYGRKPFLVIGGVFSVIRLALYALSKDFWVLALAQGIGALGEGAGAGQPLVSGYITDRTRVEHRAKVFTVIAISNALSTTLGSIMAGLPALFQLYTGLDEVDSNIPLFWIGAVLNAVSLVFVVMMGEAPRGARAESLEDAPPISWGDLAKFSFVRATDGLGMGLVTSLLPLYFYLRFGVGAESLAPVYAVARFLPVFAYALVPLMVGRLGNVRCLLIMRVLTGVIIALFAFSPNYLIGSLLFIVYRVLFEVAMPVRQSFATELGGPLRTGTVVGVSNSARAAAQSVAPVFAGFFFEASLISVPLFAGAALLAINGLQYKYFYGGGEQHQDSPRGDAGP
jgi:MFS family permease